MPPSGVQEKFHKVPKSASQMLFSFMNVTLYAAHQAPHRALRFASRSVQARSVRCSETSTCSVDHVRDATVIGHRGL